MRERHVSGRSVREQRVNKLGEAIGFHLDLRQELTPRLVIPLDVGSLQAGDESFDVTRRQAQLMRDDRKPFLLHAISFADLALAFIGRWARTALPLADGARLILWTDEHGTPAGRRSGRHPTHTGDHGSAAL